MSEKKNIDRLFQEQFKDFETAPPEYVWENIHDALQEKKKRRVIPLWFRLGGVAAVLLVGLFISWPYLQGINSGANGVVIEQEARPVIQPDGLPSKQRTPKGPGFQRGIIRPADSNNTIVNADNDTDKTGSADKIKNGGHTKGTGEELNTKSNKFGTTNDAVAGTPRQPQDKTGVKSTRLKSKKANNLNDRNQDAVAGANTLKSGNHNNGKSNSGKTGRNTTDGTTIDVYDKRANAVANNTDNRNGLNKNNTNKNKGIAPKRNSSVSDSNRTDNNTAVAQNNTADKNKVDGSNASAENKVTGGVNASIPVIEKNIPVEQAVAAVDTVKPVKENELEKILREKQEGKKEEQVAENNTPKWNIKPQVAPVFYNSLSQGSPIDQQFASNAKSYNNDLSMGVGINYAVTDRLKIRSGVNTVNLNYATQDVQFYASLGGSTNNIAPQARNANIVVQDKIEGQAANPNAAFASTADAYSGSMVQRTGYLEVPVEMSYALLNKKFGIELIGGVSTLFLNQNNVSVVSTQGLSTNVGEAENLNNIHFSTNVGVGFRYRFFRAFEASFEPTFKYQVNTFSRDAGNFKPYFIGLYSGISFSF